MTARPSAPSVTPSLQGSTLTPAYYALALGNFAIGMGSLVIAGILRPLAVGLHTAIGDVGQLVTVYALAYALAAPLLNAVTRAVPRKRLVLVGLALCVAGNLLGALAPAFGAMLATRVLVALGAALFTPTASAIAAATSAPERRAQAIGLVFGGLTVATALGVPAGAFIGLHYGWRAAFIAVAVVALAGIVAVTTTLPADVAAPAPDPRAWGRLLRRGVILLAVAVTLLQSTAQFTVFTYISPLLARAVHLDATGITLALLLFGLASIIGNVGAGYLADRWGAARSVTLTLLALIPALAALAFLHGSVPLAAICLTLWGAMGFGFNVPQQARLVLLAPTAASATLALNASALYMGSALGATAGGALVKGNALLSLGPVGAALVVLALLASLAVHDTRRRGATRANRPV